MKYFALALAVILVLSGCASQPKIGIDDPFSDQLAHYYYKQQRGKTYLFLSAVAFASSFLAGTYFTTVRSLGNESLFNDVGFYSSYSLSAVSACTGVFSFLQWSSYSSLYLETLRLQTQYYNVVQP